MYAYFFFSSINGLLEEKNPEFTSQKNTVFQVFFGVKKVAKIKILCFKMKISFAIIMKQKKHFQEFLAFSIFFFCTFLIKKNLTTVFKNKQDSTLFFFVNSHSQIRGAQIF
jgi:hypothetical protein